MFAETLAGIALVKSAVDGIKSAISTARDVGEIADELDKLFTGEQQIQKKKNKKANDPFSVGSVARETIDAKIAAEHRQEIATLIDLRFGHGTWQGIINERAKRLREHQEAEKTTTPRKREAAGRADDRRCHHPRAAHCPGRLRVPLPQICLRRDTP